MRAASGSTEDIGALSLALQIIDASQELQDTVLHLKKLMPDVPAKHTDQIQPTAQGRPGHHLVLLCKLAVLVYVLLCCVLLHCSTRDIQHV